MPSPSATDPEFERAVILGAGEVGRLLRANLASVCRSVDMFDVHARPDTLPGDATAPRGELAVALTEADLCILALPESALLAALPVVASAMKGAGLIVETGSIKTPVLEILASLPASIEVLGIHPMFAPSLGFSGQTVAAIPFTGGPRTDRLCRVISHWKANLTVITAERHDELLGLVQSGTHATLLAFGEMLARTQYDLAELMSLSTPPFRTLILLLARILTQSPTIFWHIQADNPHAAAHRRLLLEGLSRLDTLSAQHAGYLEFARWLTVQAGPLVATLPALREQSDRLLSRVQRLELHVE